MRKKLTNNFYLKLISILAAFVLWLVVINVDDPVITRTYTGIPVEVINDVAIKSQGKTYEVLDNSDTISVVVSAKRSVIEKMSRDYIKATADMKDITFMDTVAIAVKSNKYADRIESISPLTKNLKVKIEDMQKIQIPIDIETVGDLERGYVVGDMTSSVNMVSVSGPISVVSKIKSASVAVDVEGMKSDISINGLVKLYDGNKDEVKTDTINMSISEVHVNVEVLETKEIPISALVSGTPADGYMATGVVIVEPESILVAGDGRNFKELSSIVIPGKDVSLDGANADTIVTLNINDYLPGGVRTAAEDYDGTVNVTCYVGKLETAQIDVPTTNISIVNVPEGYAANLVDIGGTKRIEVTGLADVLAATEGMNITGTIDASTLLPRGELKDGSAYYEGSNDGLVNFVFPTGVSGVDMTYMEVSLYRIDNSNDDLTDNKQVPVISIEP